MADFGSVAQEISGLPSEWRPIFLRIFQSVLRDLRIGHPTGGDPDPLKNFGGGFYHATTPSVPGTEFSIAHGFGRTPYLIVPCLPLDVLGAQIVPVTVSRVADDRRIYLTSTVADAPISLIVEG